MFLGENYKVLEYILYVDSYNILGSGNIQKEVNLYIDESGNLGLKDGRYFLICALEVDNNIDRLTLSYEFAEPNASIKVEGGNFLNVGKNEKKIIVTSENGETKVYTFIINRAEKEIITEVKDENDKNQNENKDIVNISNSKKDNSNVLLIIIVLVIMISIIGIIIFKKIKNKK